LIFEDQEFHDCELTLSNGRKHRVFGSWIHNQNLDYWQGWECSAGKERLFIDENLNVYSGECQNDYLGNLTEQWNPLANNTTCKKVRCSGCNDDLIVSKKEIK